VVDDQETELVPAAPRSPELAAPVRAGGELPALVGAAAPAAFDRGAVFDGEIRNPRAPHTSPPRGAALIGA
jgi:hypothetical protein